MKVVNRECTPIHANFIVRYPVRIFGDLQQIHVRIAIVDVAFSIVAERRHAIASDFSPMKTKRT